MIGHKETSMRGYSQIVIENNQSAKNSLGVSLGAVCIKTKYPAQEVANRLNISRQTVYDWFSGKSKPHKSKHDLIQALIEELST
jgi:DNA-binding transcriptional regulator YiaG|tara:strand:+ start:1600 stop:1851 length:252 start_codon:yes stop_codon:yes gene_type:complete